MRFGIFQKALSPPPPKPKRELGNSSSYADLTREEMDDEFSYGYYRPVGCYVSPSDMDVLPGLAKIDGEEMVAGTVVV
ncbi:hypothetical protein TSUD_261760 [Trifolium subterraneum]|nr:hypothetical protein TSUD_261760 [Trifolium subterraneum]